jgi:hypothetical protein
MTLPARDQPGQKNPAANRWTVVCYALDSTARTLRLCAIMFAIGVPPGLVALLVRR